MRLGSVIDCGNWIITTECLITAVSSPSLIYVTDLDWSLWYCLSQHYCDSSLSPVLEWFQFYQAVLQ